MADRVLRALQHLRRRSLRLGLVVVLGLPLTAAAAPDIPDRFPPGPWLTDIRIQGPDALWPGIFPRDPDLPALTPMFGASDSKVDARQTAFTARSALSHPLPEWWQSVPGVRSFTPVPAADVELLQQDARNLRLWFMDRGWLDCSVQLELTTDDSVWGRWLNRRRPDSARRATFVVDTGERWTVRDWEIDGLDTVKRPARRELRDAVLVVPGPYDGDARAQSEAEFSRLLSERGFSHPLVTSVLVPHAESRSVTVLFHIDPGERAFFGPLEVSGLPDITTERLTRRVASAVPEGERWRGSQLGEVEASLRHIPSFAHVEVAPGDLDANEHVPVRVTVTESDTDGLFPIVEIASDPTFFAVEAGLGYRTAVVGRQLATFEARGAAGYRSFPVPFGDNAFWGNHGPAGRAGLTTEVFLAPLAGLSVLVEGEGSLDAVRANNRLTAAVRSGLRVRPGPRVELSVTPELVMWKNFAWPAQQALWDKWFVEPGDPPLPPMLGRHRTTFRPFSPGALVRIGLDWSEVDQPMMPTRGGELHIDAIPIGVAGVDPFWRVEATLRRYIDLGSPRWVLVPRFDAGVFRFHDPTVPSVPQLRFYLGGGSSLRGWGVAQANPPGWDGDGNDLRIGGNVLGMGSLELRFAVWPRLHLIAFSDAGRTWESLADRTDPTTRDLEPGVRVSTLLPSAGAGIALPTPIGRAVLSGAVRLREDTELVHPPARSTVHFSLVQSY